MQVHNKCGVVHAATRHGAVSERSQAQAVVRGAGCVVRDGRIVTLQARPAAARPNSQLVMRPQLLALVLLLAFIGLSASCASGAGSARSVLPERIPDDLRIAATKSQMFFSEALSIEQGRFVYQGFDRRSTESEDQAIRFEWEVPTEELHSLYQTLVACELHTVVVVYDPLVLAQAGSSSIDLVWTESSTGQRRRLSIFEGGSSLVALAASGRYFKALDALFALRETAY